MNNEIDSILAHVSQEDLYTLTIFNNDTSNGLGIWKSLIDYGHGPVFAAKLINKVEKYGSYVVLTDSKDRCFELAARLMTWGVDYRAEPI